MKNKAINKRPKHPKVRLVPISAFDARRGYKRCTLPGVGCGEPYLTTDFWRNRTGGLVVRFSSNEPYVFQFEAFLADGRPVPEEDIDEFGYYIMDVLSDWGGTDESPDPDFMF